MNINLTTEMIQDLYLMYREKLKYLIKKPQKTNIELQRLNTIESKYAHMTAERIKLRIQQKLPLANRYNKDFLNGETNDR